MWRGHTYCTASTSAPTAAASSPDSSDARKSALIQSASSQNLSGRDERCVADATERSDLEFFTITFLCSFITIVYYTVLQQLAIMPCVQNLHKDNLCKKVTERIGSLIIWANVVFGIGLVAIGAYLIEVKDKSIGTIFILNRSRTSYIRGNVGS